MLLNWQALLKPVLPYAQSSVLAGTIGRQFPWKSRDFWKEEAMFQKAFLRPAHARRLRYRMIVLCAIGIIVLLAVGSPLLAEPGTVTMRVDPATRTVPVNGTFTVNIVADVGTEMNLNGLGAYEFNLVCNPPGYLEVISVDDAGELDNTGRTVVELGPNINNPAGLTAFGAYSYYAGTPQIGGPKDATVVLATVTLQAKKVGVTTLNLENALLTDTHGNAWPDAGAGRGLNVQGGTVMALPVLADFDGDGKMDMGVFRPSWGAWFILRSDSDWTTYIAKGWGASGDIPLAGDFDGDGKADMAIFRPSWGTWFVLLSGSNYTTSITKVWGTNGDTPLVGDFDGDGKADMAIFRPSWGAWFVLLSGSNYTTSIAKGWGTNGDVPLAGDFDGDGKADMAVFRPSWGAWFVLLSGSNYTTSIAKGWGANGDVPLAGDFDGDGKKDMAIFRPSWGTWFVLLSGSNYTTSIAKVWGTIGDTLLAGDFDGDGKADMAIFRPSWGAWFILRSDSDWTTSIAKGWGTNGDIPVGQ